jgi:hypothetical protein
MTRTLFSAVAVAAAFATVSLPAEAAKRKFATGQNGSLSTSQATPLTAAECNRAQGAVVTDNSCGTGAACVKDGPNGPSKICLSFSQ